MRTEIGVMVMKGSKAWGITTETATDVTYSNSPYVAELKTASLVDVKRTTTVEFM